MQRLLEIISRGADMAATLSRVAKPAEAPELEKVGAGLLFLNIEKGEVLLLFRNSKNNDKTWGLPGGNKEERDGKLPTSHNFYCILHELMKFDHFLLLSTIKYMEIYSFIRYRYTYSKRLCNE